MFENIALIAGSHDQRKLELQRQALQGDFGAEVQLLHMRMRAGEIPVDYVRRAAALGDRRAQALGLSPWRVSNARYHRFMRSILRGLTDRSPESNDKKKRRLVESFAADVAERVLSKYENRYPGDTRPRDAIEATRRWVEDPSEENQKAANAAYSAADAALDDTMEDIYGQVLGRVDGPARAATNAADAVHCAISAVCYRADDINIADFTASACCRARVAAGAAKRAAEQAWQKRRLIRYLLGDN